MIDPIVKVAPRLLDTPKERSYYRTTLGVISTLEYNIDLYNNHNYDTSNNLQFEFNYIVDDTIYTYQKIPPTFIYYSFDTQYDNIIEAYQFINGISVPSNHLAEYNQFPDTWHNISRYQTLSEDFIREFKNEVDWHNISRYQTLSEDFIREFKNEVDWIWIFKYQKITSDLVTDFELYSESILTEYLTLLNIDRAQDLIIGENFITTKINEYLNFKKSFLNYLTQTDNNTNLNILKNGILSFPYPADINTNDILNFKQSEQFRIDNSLDNISDTIETVPTIDPLPGEPTASGQSTYSNLNTELDTQLTNIKDNNILFEYQVRESAETDYILKNHNELCWSMISQYQKLQLPFIRLNQNKLNWVKLSRYQDIVEITLEHDIKQFVYEFISYIDWYTISKYQRLSEDFIREFQDNISWKNVSRYQQLSEQFIDEFQNEIDWFWINEHQRPISLEFYNKFKSYLR